MRARSNKLPEGAGRRLLSGWPGLDEAQAELAERLAAEGCAGNWAPHWREEQMPGLLARLCSEITPQTARIMARRGPAETRAAMVLGPFARFGLDPSAADRREMARWDLAISSGWPSGEDDARPATSLAVAWRAFFLKTAGERRASARDAWRRVAESLHAGLWGGSPAERAQALPPQLRMGLSPLMQRAFPRQSEKLRLAMANGEQAAFEAFSAMRRRAQEPFDAKRSERARFWSRPERLEPEREAKEIAGALARKTPTQAIGARRL
jgi:hypothetical protein